MIFNIPTGLVTVSGGTTISKTYTYDGWDNMVQSVSGDDTVEYAYDGAGLRYGKRVNGGAQTVSLYEYDRVILEINGSTGAQAAAAAVILPPRPVLSLAALPFLSILTAGL